MRCACSSPYVCVSRAACVRERVATTYAAVFFIYCWCDERHSNGWMGRWCVWASYEEEHNKSYLVCLSNYHDNICDLPWHDNVMCVCLSLAWTVIFRINLVIIFLYVIIVCCFFELSPPVAMCLSSRTVSSESHHHSSNRFTASCSEWVSGIHHSHIYTRLKAHPTEPNALQR